jgi:carboxymethylenebutenolidase
MPAELITVNHHTFDIPVELWVPAEETAATNGVANGAALLLLHDQWGPDDFTRAAALRLADSGYVVALPDLFARRGGPKEDTEVARQDFLFALSDSEVVSDAVAALGSLTNQANVNPKLLGVIGWGWGGARAIMLGGHDARVRAVVNVGGDITFPVLTANHTGSPLNFIADIEGSIFAAFPEKGKQPSSEILRLRERIIEHDKVGEVKIYSGTTERFWREDTPQAAALWSRIEQFLAESFDPPLDDEFYDAGYPNEESRLHA